MTRDQLVKVLSWRLGNRKDMEERIIAELDYVQENVLEANQWLPWFLETELAQASTTIGESRVVLPPDFLMEIEESHLWIITDTGDSLRLVKGDYDTLKSKHSGTGIPVRYSMSGKYYHLFPAPAAVYTIEMRYYAKAALMSQTEVESSWLVYASDLVAAAVGKELAEKHLQNPALAQSFTNDLSQAWARLLAKHTALGEVNQSRSMNGES